MKRFVYTILICSVVALTLLVTMTVRTCSAPSDEAGTDSIVVDTTALMLTEMHRCSRIYTSEVKIHKIITHDDVIKLKGTLLGKELSLDVPAGHRKVAIPICATVKASINMGELTSNDIVRHGNHIEVFLPKPEVKITETHIDHDEVKEYVSLGRSRFTDAELSSYEKKGREALEQDVSKMNLQPQAMESAARLLIPIIKQMGFREQDITISFRDNDKQLTIERKQG